MAGEPDSPTTTGEGADEGDDRSEHLLRSIEDLDREFEAGDIDESDFRELRAEYTARAAAALRGDEPAAPAPTRSWRRTVAVFGALLCVATLTGVVLARAVGQRGGGGLTGDAGGLRERLAACQPLAFQQPAKGVVCYQKILNDAPDDLDALTYQGWALVRADRAAEGGRNFARVVALDPRYPDVRVFRAILATRAERFADAAAEINTFFRNDPPPIAAQVLRTEGLEVKIFIGLLPNDARACWVNAAEGADVQRGFDQPFIDRLATCLDQVLEQTPDDEAARFSRALAAIGPDRQDASTARRLVDGLLEDNPANPNALLLRARLHLADGRLDAAARDARQLEDLARPTAAFLLGEPSELADAIAAAQRAVTTTTSRSATVSTVPGAPIIPNAGGG